MRGLVATLTPVHGGDSVSGAGHITSPLEWMTTSLSVCLFECLLPGGCDHRGVRSPCAGFQILNLLWEACAYEALLTEMTGFLQSLQVGKILLTLNSCDAYLRIKGTVPLDFAVEGRVLEVTDSL